MCLSNSLDVSVFVAPPGVGLIYHERYLDFDSWYFMQCTNCASFMPGLLAIAKLSSKQSDEFKHANTGFVEDCFLCTPQYIFREGGHINYGIKCLKKDSTITLADAVKGTQNVAEMLFSEDLLTIPVHAIDMVYLNRITGCLCQRVPKMHKTYIDAEGLTWCQQGERPDSWSIRLLHRITCPPSAIKSPGTRLIPTVGSKYKHHRSLREFNNSTSTVMVCKDHNHYVPFYGGLTYELVGGDACMDVTFTCLSPDNSAEFEMEYAKHEGMNANDYNELLLSFEDPIITSRRVSVMKDGYTNNTFVSLCRDDEFSSLRDESMYVNDGILSILLESTPNGCLDVPVGLPIHQIFSWPYEGITRSHVDVLGYTFKGSDTKRSCTEHFGLFQSMGFRAHSRCSSSLCEHPDLKTKNQYWNWGMNSGLFPFASSIRNSLFRQAHNVSHTCGDIISRLTQQDPNFDYTRDRASLVTVNYANASHRDSRDWMPTPCYVSDQLMALSRVDWRVQRYCSQLDYFCRDNKLPISTTCCWVYMDENEEIFQMRQFFVNFTAGIAQDITSSGYESTKQIGANFFGSMFDHCTTRPIWVSSIDNTVMMRPPTDYGYNFAWGKWGSR